MIKTKIVFDHRGRTPKGQEGPLEVRVTIDRQPYYVQTGIKVKKSEWTGMRIASTRNNAEELQDRLDIVLRKVEQEINDCIEAGRTVDVAEVRRRVWQAVEPKKETSETPFIDWIKEQCDVLNVSEGTAKHYVTLVRRLVEFGGLARWRDVTVEGIYAWDEWLHRLTKPQNDADVKAGRKAEHLSDGAIFNYHKCLKALLARADRLGKIERNPYDRLKGEFKRGDRVDRVDYLTEKEMNDFEVVRAAPGSPCDVAHDLFIFQMYTGLAYSDMQAFNIADYREVDGKWMNVGERIKTGVPYVSRLLPPAIEVLKKYNWQIPRMGNADYNHALKILAEMAGLNRPLHSHMARHTFATYMLRHEVKIEHVSRMLGHTNITQTQRYARVMAQSVHEDFDKIADVLSGKNDSKKNEENADSDVHGPADGSL